MYAQFVEEHPEWELQPVNPCELESPGSRRGRNAEFAGGRVVQVPTSRDAGGGSTNEQVKERRTLPTWEEVFRRIGLDERDHMNMSYVFYDRLEWVVKYAGMPEKPGLIHDQCLMTAHSRLHG